jgi:predicted PurR-regulated permease PerM
MASRTRVPSGSDSAGLPPLAAFASRLVVLFVVIALAVSLWRLTDILVLLFGATLLAIGLSACARFVRRHTGVPEALALFCVIGSGLAAFTAVLWLFGSVARRQIAEVALAAPTGFRVFWDRMGADPYGRVLIDQARMMNLSDATSWATSTVTSAATTLSTSLGYVVVAVFVGIYLAAQPKRYRHMCLRLVPPVCRETALRLCDVTGIVLQRWIAGQVVVMTTIGVLSGLGLWFLGIEAAFALGLMSGLLSFIPFVGAIVAAIPAILVALTQGPTQAGLVTLMYLAVHLVEGNFITPLVQAEATSLPPVLAILSTVAFTVLFGPVAVLLAAPLTLFFMAAVEVLYVQASLGEKAEGPTELERDSSSEISVPGVAKPASTKW